MLLAIDIGNTNIVIGLWNGREWQNRWRLRTIRERTTDEYAIYLRGLLETDIMQNQISRIIIASVVPQITRALREACQRYLKQEPLIVTTNLSLGIQNCTDAPDQVGADRLVNTAAAYHLYKSACIVVDMGTATKFDVVTSQGDMLGGVISPGLGITADALTRRAAKLSQVDLEAPPQVIGRNTIHAIQSGLIYGYAGLVSGLLPRLKTELKIHDPQADRIRVIGTGGLISLIAEHTDFFDNVDPWLTLKGLEIISRKN